MWLSPNIVSDLIWDYNMCVNNNVISIIKELCQKALKAPLTPEEIKVDSSNIMALSIITRF